MNQNELAILLRAYDQFSNTFQRFQQTLRQTATAQGQVQRATEQLNRAHGHQHAATQQAAQGHQHLHRILGEVGILYAYKRAIEGIVSAGANLEDALYRLQAITGDTTDQVKAFLMASTGERFGPRRQAEALVELGAAGLTAVESLQALPSVMDFATAAQIDLGRSAEATLVILKTYQMEADKAVHVTDAFTLAANKSALQGEDLTISLGMSAAAARLAGMEFEELLAVLSVLRDAGLRASDAGTSVKSAIIALLSPSKEAQDLLDQLGIQIHDSSGRMKTWSGIVAEFERELSKLDERSKQYVLTTIFGTDGIRAFTLSMDRGSQFIEQMTRELKSTDGVTKSVAATMKDSFSAALDRTQGNMERLAATIFDDLKPGLSVVLGVINNLIVGLQNMNSGWRTMVVLLLGAGGVVVAIRLTKQIMQELVATMALVKAASVATGAGSVAKAAGTAATAATVGIMGARYAQMASGLLVPAGAAAAGGAAAVSGGAAAAGGLAALTGPAAIALAAIAALTVGVAYYTGRQKEAARAQQEHRQEVIQLAAQYETLTARGEDASLVTARLGQLVPGLARDFDGQGNATRLAADALQEYVDALRAVEGQALKTDLAKIRKELADTQRRLEDWRSGKVVPARPDPADPFFGGFSDEEMRRLFEIADATDKEKAEWIREHLKEAASLQAEEKRLLAMIAALNGAKPLPPRPYGSIGYDWSKTGGGGRSLDRGSGDSRTPLERELDRLTELIRVRELEMELADGTAQEAGKRQALIRAYGDAIAAAARNVDAMATAHGRNSEEALKATVRLLELRKALQDLNQESRGGFDQDLGRTALFRVTAEANQAAFDRIRAMAASAMAQGRMEIVFKGHITSEGPALTDRQVQEIVVPAVSQAMVERYDKGTRHVPEIVAPGANYR